MKASELTAMWERVSPHLTPPQISARVCNIYLEAHRQGVEANYENVADLQESILTRQLHESDQVDALVEFRDEMRESNPYGDAEAYHDFIQRLFRMVDKLHQKRAALDQLLL